MVENKIDFEHPRVPAGLILTARGLSVIIRGIEEARFKPQPGCRWRMTKIKQQSGFGISLDTWAALWSDFRNINADSCCFL